MNDENFERRLDGFAEQSDHEFRSAKFCRSEAFQQRLNLAIDLNTCRAARLRRRLLYAVAALFAVVCGAAVTTATSTATGSMAATRPGGPTQTLYDEAAAVFGGSVGIVVADGEVSTYPNRLAAERLGAITLVLTIPGTAVAPVTIIFSGFDGKPVPVAANGFSGTVTPFDCNGELLLQLELKSPCRTISGIAMPSENNRTFNADNLI